MLRKREGFKGQIAIVLPQFIQEEMRIWPMTKLLFVTRLLNIIIVTGHQVQNRISLFIVLKVMDGLK
jgi:hypothetical protein